MEGMDDVSSSGRVTRSLRKRLTSVDSNDAGSRPTTPQLTKLVSIPELSSPSRSLRTTRRNSTTGYGTPLKTPARSKTSTISESRDVENSVPKRVGRMSGIFGENSPTPMKIVELTEEDNSIIKKNSPPRRSARLPSKSPTQLEEEKAPRSGSGKSSKPGPKSRRSRQMSESDSEVEVTNLENDDKIKITKRLSPRLKAKSASHQIKGQTIETIDLSEVDGELHEKEQPVEDMISLEKVEDNMDCIKTTESIKVNTEESAENNDTNIDFFKSKSETTPLKENCSIEAKSKCDSTLRIQVSDGENEVEISSAEKNISPKIGQTSKNQEEAYVESVVMLEKLSPKVIAKLCGEEDGAISPPNSKSVTFNDIDEEDDMVKSIYPKTPASIKSKSCVTLNSSKDSDDKSFQSDKGSSASFKDASAYIDECKDPENQSKESVEFHDATNVPEEDNFENALENIPNKTPQQQKQYMKLQSSTPMTDSVGTSKSEPQETLKAVEEKNRSTSSPEKLPITSTLSSSDNIEPTTNQEKILPSPVKDDKSSSFLPKKLLEGDEENDNLMTSTTTEVINANNGDTSELFSKSWTHNVSVCATTVGKIDTISAVVQKIKVDQEITSGNSELANKQKIVSGAEAKGTNIEESDEEGSFQKLFVDEEAVEAPDNYESGDSMDEEERREMEENEILDEGESIGSVDSVTEESDEADADENASFVTSDTDHSLLDYSNENEDFEEPNNSKNRNSSFLTTSESEDQEEQSVKENKVKVVTNGNSEKKPNKQIRNRNRILDSSESENEVLSETKFNQENAGVVKNSEELNKPLDFEVSRMIDESTDDEPNEDETSANVPSVTDKTNNGKMKDLINEPQDENMNTNGCNDNSSNKLIKNRKNNFVYSLKSLNNDLNEFNELVTRKIPERTASSQIKSKDNETIKSGSEDSRSQSPRTSARSLDSSMEHEDTKSPKKESNDRKKSENFRGAQTEQKIAKSLNITNTSTTPEKITEANDTITVVNQNCSHNESELNISIKKPKQSFEAYDANERNASTSKNELYEEENNEVEDIEIPETQDVEPAFEGTNSDDIAPEESTDDNEVEDIDYLLSEASKPKKSGLSVSFCQGKQMRNSSKKKNKNQHTSFTIGVNVINTESGSPKSSGIELDGKLYNSDKDSSDSGKNNAVKKNTVHVEKEEEDEIEKLLNSEKQFSILNRQRKSMASLDVQDAKELTHDKKPNRKSLQPIPRDEFNPSQSLIENNEHRKRELKTQITASKPRLSKSFCGPIQDGVNELTDNRSSEISDKDSENENEAVTRVSHRHINKNKSKDLRHITDRCDQILEAANRAKYVSKKNYKKSMVICPKSKKNSKYSGSLENGSEITVPIVKDEKYSKEKTTLALEQAFKASAKILMNEGVKNKKDQTQKNEDQSSGKRLPLEILESLSKLETRTEIKNSHKETRSAFVQRINYATGDIVEEPISPPRKKRAILNKFELPTGTVLEEPITPKKKIINGGFRESPVTPRTLGFKVRHILTSGQDKIPELQTSHQNKRKQKIDEPKRVLPKPQWSQSGVFLEELVPSLNAKQRQKFKRASSNQSFGKGAATATLSALNFKNSIMMRKNIIRESAHELVKRKERQGARSYF